MPSPYTPADRLTPQKLNAATFKGESFKVRDPNTTGLYCHIQKNRKTWGWAFNLQMGAHASTLAAAQLLVYTMTRKNEVLRMKWTELSPEGDTWVIPASRYKTKINHSSSCARARLAATFNMQSTPKGRALLSPSSSWRTR